MAVPDLQAEWSRAIVAEPIGFVDESLHTVGAVTLKSGIVTILSLSPGEDFELNTNIIHDWKIVFQTSDSEVLGDADYRRAIKELKPYILDQQNGSLLVRAFDDNELHELFVQCIFD